MKKNATKAKAKKPAPPANKFTPWMARQGDVLLTGIETMPADAVEQKRPRGASLVLQQGNATGHAHQIKARACSLHVKGDARYLRVVEPVDLTHEEHKTVLIPAGDYIVSIHHEYSPGELPRQVLD